MGELSKQYEGKVEFSIASAKTPEGQAAVKQYGLDARQHGLVMLDSAGTVQVRMSGHSFSKDQIESELESLLE